MKKLLGVICLPLLLGISVFAQSEGEDAVDLVLGGGLVLSPEYSDFIDDAYGPYYNHSGGQGWLDLYGGVEIRPVPQFGVLLLCGAMVNGTDISGGPLEETYANVIVAPSVYGQYYFTEKRSCYINGGISLPIPYTGSDYFELENNGLGLGVNVGFEIAGVLRIEGGYLVMPVRIKATSENPVYATGTKADYNFGGLQLRAMLAF